MSDEYINRPVGRPPLPENISRTERIVTFLSKSEKQALNSLAGQKCCSISSISHELIVEGLKKFMPELD